MQKNRLDILLVEKGLVESRSLAQRLVMAGQVRVDGQVLIKPSVRVAEDAVLSIDRGPKFVSRGGEKLEPALISFGFDDLSGRICADIGASTGGFTDCMLQHGAAHVFAVDVGYGILHWKLRTDPRVTTMERTNARYIGGFAQPVSFITMDASFISLTILLPAVRSCLAEQGGDVVALIKPQFEAGKEDAAKGEGVIRDPAIHREVIERVLKFAIEQGFGIAGLVKSSLLGPKGNTEFLVHLIYPGQGVENLEELIEFALVMPAGDQISAGE